MAQPDRPATGVSEPPPERPQPVEFVCEADVRLAIQESRKICIGPRTIVTPSARDLAGSLDILVLFQG